MAKQSFALEPGGQKRLEVAWKWQYKNTTVSLDGRALGTIPDQRALRAGQHFQLVDGSIIKVQLVAKWYGSELQVHRDGQPLPGSASDPGTRLKNAYWMVYFVAGLNIALGLISLLLNVTFLQELGLGFFSIIYGVVFLVLGFFVQRKSTIALILAIIIFALDGILGCVLSAVAGSTPSVGGLLVRIILLVPMIQGVGAIKALKAGMTGAVVPPPVA